MTAANDVPGDAADAASGAILRPYRATDRAACLRLFESNVPDYFAPIEREDFIATLEAELAAYLVVEAANGELLGCGGYDRADADPSIAVLCWGMIRRDLHRRGLGERLLVERLQRIAEDPTLSSVMLETTPYSRGFYERHGFAVERVVPDGFAPGFDRVEMSRPARRG